MKAIIFFILLAISGFFIWQEVHPYFYRLQPLYNYPYIIIYGRTDDRPTMDMINDLRAERLRYFFKEISGKEAIEEVNSRMRQAGISQLIPSIPVLDVNTKIFVRPDLTQVKRWYGWSMEDAAKRTLAMRLKTGDLHVSEIIRGAQPMAIIDGQVVKVGDVVGGYRVLEINNMSVRLKDFSGRIVEKQYQPDSKK